MLTSFNIVLVIVAWLRSLLSAVRVATTPYVAAAPAHDARDVLAAGGSESTSSGMP